MGTKSTKRAEAIAYVLLSGTGKSSLVQRYVHESFDNTITTTVGAGFANKRM